MEKLETKIGKTATQVYGQGIKMIVRYHETNVVEFDDKEIKLNSGGWFTQTTKRRMNQASGVYNLGYYVYQKDGQWITEYKGKLFPWNGDMMTIERGIL